MSKNYALITGASSGLGKSISGTLASMGYNLILVSYPDEMLEATTYQFKSMYNIDVKSIPIDLSRKNACKKVAEEVLSYNVDISILVNNVGVGDVTHFEHTDTAFNRRLIRLNCLVMVELTQFLLPLLKKHKQSYILNIGSQASLFPVPYKAVYSASKYFVKSFSFSLMAEMKNEGISVTVVFPGSMATNEHVIRRINSFGKLAKISLSSPDFVAKASIKAMFRKRRKVTPGLVNKIYFYLRHIVGYDITMRLIKNRMYKEAVWDKEHKMKTKKHSGEGSEKIVID